MVSEKCVTHMSNAHKYLCTQLKDRGGITQIQYILTQIQFTSDGNRKTSNNNIPKIMRRCSFCLSGHIAHQMRF